MQYQDENTAFPFELLPIDIVFNILNHLPITEAAKISLLNKYFLLVSNDERYWLDKLRTHFPHHSFEAKLNFTRNSKIEYFRIARSEYLTYPRSEWEVFNRIKEGNLELFKELTPVHPLHTYQDANGYNLLHWAAHNGHLETVTYLLAHSLFDLNAKTKTDFNAAELALHNNHLDIVKFFSQKGTNINFANLDNLTIALKQNHFKAVQYLVANQSIDFETIPLEKFYLLAHLANSYEITSLMLAKWSKYHNSNDSKSLLRMAMLNGDCDLTYILLHSSTSIDIDEKAIPEILISAVEQNKRNLIELIAKKFPEKINLDKLLFIAAKSGHVELVVYFISKGANCNSPSYKISPLAIAGAKNHLDVVKALVNKGAHLDAFNLDGKTEITPLIFAIKAGHYKVAEYLVEKGAKVNLSDRNGKTPLAYAAKEEDGYDMVNFLLSHQADPNAADMEGFTPLHEAVLGTQGQIVELLVNRAKLVADKNPVTPFYRLINRILTLCNYAEFAPARYLPVLEIFAKLQLLHQKDSNLNTPLHLICDTTSPNLVPLVNFFIDHGADLNAINNAGKAPIHYAVRYNQTLFEVLLARGANIKLRTPLGNTVLHIAAKRSFIPLIDLILNNGIDINITNNAGATPIHYAAKCMTGMKHIEHLITKGANIKQIDRHGNNFLHYAFSGKKAHFSKFSTPFFNFVCEHININDANKEGVNPYFISRSKWSY